VSAPTKTSSTRTHRSPTSLVGPGGPIGRLLPEASIAELVQELVGKDVPVAFEAYDGSATTPAQAAARIRITSPNVLKRLIASPDQLGLARAYAAGELDVEGDIYAALSIRDRVPEVHVRPAQWASAVRMALAGGWRLPPPAPGEARLRGRVHSRARDAAAISHHYDVSNDFYRLFLGPSMTYTCALWHSPDVGVDAAQAAKHELVCRKLGLQPGMRLLDVGCGWGGMSIHAALHHGVHAVGVTLSRRQAEWGQKAVADAGVADRVEIRHQDYRDVDDGPYDAIASIGLIEHVGSEQLAGYARHLYDLLRPGGRLLNHGIATQPKSPARLRRLGRFASRRRAFLYRFVFPDGELMEVGKVVSGLQEAGFEARHLESLREHYALTLRAWVDNLERHWDEAVAEVGEARARIWRLYMAGSVLSFESGDSNLYQVLAVKPDGARSGLPLRPVFE
jgi:cyclopropane-fatty-acyl-phospholipid synthase